MSLSELKAIKHLQKDKVLAKIVSEDAKFKCWKGENLFEAIAKNIIGQQLSSIPAKIISGRFVTLFDRKRFPKPKEVLAMPDQKIRDCGLSWAKTRYIKCLSQAVVDKTLEPEKIKTLADEDVITELTKVKGIGRWTAEMILIFHLQRPDIFSLGDLGLRTAVGKLYGVDRNDLKKIEKISQKWRPYRSLASRYLWRSLDN